MWCDFRQQVFDVIHGLVHPEVCATTCLVSNRFVWPRLVGDIKEWSKQCVACDRAKVTHVEHSGVEKIPTQGSLLLLALGPGGASSCQQRRVNLPADDKSPLHQVARGDPLEPH